MHAEAARRELVVRLYRWALRQWEGEIQSGFAILEKVRGNAAVKALGLFRSLPHDERVTLARAMTKRFHKEACDLLRDPLTVDEARLLGWADTTRITSASHQRPTRLTKSLRRSVIEQLHDALGFLGAPESLSGRSEWLYVAQFGGWRIVTLVAAADRFGDCSYSHTIESMGGTPIARYLSLLSWLGISSETKWRVADEGHAAEASTAIAMLCRYFLDAAPLLLNGLTAES
jgi:hypothetical protein